MYSYEWHVNKGYFFQLQATELIQKWMFCTHICSFATTIINEPATKEPAVEMS